MRLYIVQMSFDDILVVMKFPLSGGIGYFFKIFYLERNNEVSFVP